MLMTAVEELKNRVSQLLETVSIKELIESEVLCSFIDDLEYFLETESLNSFGNFGE